uniref:Slc25a-2 n=1 Tax=Schmidtea mediterranea TaxID=79327 RepID=A0A0H3YF43_SCHMD|nr:slc25a-2 [Schmidtea mediterranea]
MEDDYEALPENSKLSDHMMAGACAGILEHALVYPFDSIKTRLQCIRPNHGIKFKGVIDGLYHIAMKEGMKHTLKGVGAVIIGAGPAHALYFASYEWVKKSFCCPSFGHLNSISYACAGAFATSLHDAIMTPADAIKQRLQMYQSPYRNSYQCFRRVLRNEGFPVLYRAYGAQLTMNLPYHSIYILIYEYGQNFSNPNRDYIPLAHIFSASVAAAISSFLTNPLDVCKTVLNTQDHCALSEWSDKNQKIHGIFASAKLIYRCEGVYGYFRGAYARMLYTIPGSAISWGVYEYFKHFLKSTNN